MVLFVGSSASKTRSSGCLIAITLHAEELAIDSQFPNAYCKTTTLRLNALDVGQMPDAVRLESRSVLASLLFQPVPPSGCFLEAD